MRSTCRVNVSCVTTRRVCKHFRVKEHHFTGDSVDLGQHVSSDEIITVEEAEGKRGKELIVHSFWDLRNLISISSRAVSQISHARLVLG
ncbi:hypothetical protein RRG08_014882 [Elysia crispata]|uniref:Uncharacterized protein n=1 Tax=Elysia crispata TaxID=231223 RepID=A0AAE1AMI4_9GAST|nr:hypothetical protein RRG08_014882 [Elysia crispata]